VNQDEGHQQELEARRFSETLPYMQTPELNKALATARKEIENPRFDSENPHYRSKFASLRAVIDATIPIAAKYGIAVNQDIRSTERGIACYMHLCHESGQEKTYGPLTMHATKSDPQGYASASTYARRYQLMSVFGVAGDADDDGNAASESAFSSVAKRSKIRNDLLKAAKDGDDKRVAEIRANLDNDQKAELMSIISKPQQKFIKESLDRIKEQQSEDAG
jgi:hypothetical protein